MPRPGDTPPKLPLAFRVGVVGHRDIANAEAIAAVVKSTLERIAASVHHVARSEPRLFDTQHTVLRLVCSMAKGGDVLAARVAHELGFELCCPLPFTRDELEPEDRAAFATFIEQNRSARVVEFELDGSTAHRPQAHADAAAIIVWQSELLLALWDGKPAAGDGGTGQTVLRALEHGLPVIWVHTDTHAVLVLTGALEEPATEGGTFTPTSSIPLDQIGRAIHAAVLLPPAEDSKAGRRDRRRNVWERPLRHYYEERWKNFRISHLWWEMFWAVLDLRPAALRTLSLRVRPFERLTEKDWSPAAHEPFGTVNQALVDHYGWTDTLATLNAEAYRSSFVVLYVLGAMAAMVAFVPRVLIDSPALPDAGGVLHVFEAALLVVIVGVVLYGRKRQWHRRWLDYRICAEMIRLLRIQIPLGGAQRFLRDRERPELARAARTWMHWHVRALDRLVGLPRVRTPKTHARRCVEELGRSLAEQIDFHHQNHERTERRERVVRRIGNALFLISALLVAYDLKQPLLAAFAHFHLLPKAAAHGEESSWSIWIAGILPALGAALAAIKDQAELGRMARRSRDMEQSLRLIRARVDRCLARETVTSGAAAELVERASERFVEEVMAWRFLLLDRPLELPH
jgi:hypothetical protein